MPTLEELLAATGNFDPDFSGMDPRGGFPGQPRLESFRPEFDPSPLAEVQPPEAAAGQKPGSSLWDRVALALSQIPDYEPRRDESGGKQFLGNLLSGAAQGFSGTRLRAMTEDMKAAEQRRARAAEINKANLTASAEAKGRREGVRYGQSSLARTRPEKPEPETVEVGGQRVSVNSRLGQRVIASGTPFETRPTPPRPRQAPRGPAQPVEVSKRKLVNGLRSLPGNREAADKKFSEWAEFAKVNGLIDLPGVRDSLTAAAHRVEAMR